MVRKIPLLLIGIILITGPAYGYYILENEDFALSLGTYLRQDLVSFKNVVDLDSSNSDDTTTYLGLDYHLDSTLDFKNTGTKFYLKLERNGPSDYDAPLFAHNTLLTSGGVIEEYRDDELLPEIEEFWLERVLPDNFGFKIGLYTYEVGHRFSLNGSFENYGLTIYKQIPDFTWRLYYCRPDINRKNHLGPRIRQDEEQGFQYQHNAANFFATDVMFNKGKSCLNPYIGALVDYTAPEKRDNTFTAPIKRDILGTLGLSWILELDKLSLKTELAHNFGKAESADAAYKDVHHAGYLGYLDIDYALGKFIPTLSFLLGSGNKATEEIASNDTLLSGKNRAFSYFSPLNKNLDDSIGVSHSDICPIVAMGSGYGLNYGVPRPGNFSVSDFDNIIIASLGFDFQATEKLNLGIFGYYLRSHQKPVGTLNGEAKFLSRELGYELDATVDYKIDKNISVAFLGGWFFPGRYYKEIRDDAEGSLFSPYVCGNGDVDPAYQIELALEFNF